MKPPAPRPVLAFAPLLLAATLLFAVNGSPLFAQAMTVNELFRSTNFEPGGQEWIEIVLLQDLTAAELEGYYVGDSTVAGDIKAASLRFANMASIAPLFHAGTILLIGGDGAVTEDTSYAFPADRKIAFSATGMHLVPRGMVDFDVLDVVWIDTMDFPDAAINAGGFGARWGGPSGALAVAASVAIPTPPNSGPESAALLGSVADAATGANWMAAPTPTPGAGNGGANSASIASLPVELSAFALE